MYSIKGSSIKTVMHVSLVYVYILVVGLVGLGTTPALSQPEDGPLEYYILEELTEGTLIGNVAVDAKLTDRYDRATLAQLQYSFLGEGGDGQKYFALDERTGMVRTRSRIDRDTICPHELTCYVWLDVAVQPPQFFQVIKMKVDILDVNDHEPRFPQRSIELLIPESAPSGSVYPLPTATDPDSGSYGVQDYQLVTSNNRFELQATRNPIDGSVDLKLVLRKHLDRERDGYHQLIVVAKDGGAPPKTGTININVTVEDMNDNDPIFTNASYEVFVLENVAAGSTIARVSANDADSGANGQIIYNFADSTLLKYGGVFGLNNATGRIYLKHSLDFESASTYLLTVIGRDQGPGSRLGRAVVVVRVRDDNDNVPKITVNALTTSGVAQASETAPPGTFVAHVSITDADSGNNGKVTCFVSYARDHFKLVPLYTSQYKLITDSRLDREATDQYWVMITCHDHGNPQNSANKNITVRVMDENDHEPVFSQNIYTSELLENNYIGAAIVKLNATDMDSENNGQVRFKVEQDWEGRINVQPITGQVSAGDVFDREQVDQISFDVVAYDLGKPSRSSTAKVIVNILDVNDEIPQFTHRTYSLGVFENEKAGTDVGNVRAEDRDTGINSQFDYVIVDSDTDANRWFTIDPKSGRIITKVVFDREQLTTYKFRVRAANTGYPPMSSTAQVTVYIADRNDNSPVFEFPTDLNSTVYTSNMVPVGDIITRVIVHDIDSGANKKLTHYLVSGNDDNIFQLDSQTGELAIGTSMMSIKYKVYKLRIVVKDGGHPPQRTSADLRIVVNHSIAFHQANEPPPTLSRDTLTIIVAMSFAGLILIIVVCLTVCIIIKKSRHAKKHSGKYSCRNERERMLSALDDRERQRQYAEMGGEDSSKSPLNQKDCKQKYEPDMGDMDDYKKHVAEENEKQDSRFIISVSPSKDYMKNKSPAHLPQKPDLTRSHVVYMRADGDRSSTGSDHTSSADSGRGHSDGETHRYTLQPVDSPEPDLRVSDEEEVFIPLSRALRHQRL